jgi:hypothetical protein
MKHLLFSFLFVFAFIFNATASGVKAAYNNAETNATADAATKQQLDNAKQLATFRMALENAIEKTPKMAISKRIALKTTLNKVKKAEKTNSDLNSLLMTVGIILIIVGLVLIILGVVLTAGSGFAIGYSGGGGLLVLGLILWLIGKYVDL